MLTDTRHQQFLRALERHIQAIFGPTGFLVHQKGFRYRKAQHDYALAVAHTLARDMEGVPVEPEQAAALRLLEAETGTGKTLGYLIPIALCCEMTGERAAVSTYTRQLQLQIRDKEWPIVAEATRHLLGSAPHMAVRFGRGNYLCEIAIEKFIREKCSPVRERALIETLLALKDWAIKPETSGLREDALAELGLADVPDSVKRGIAPDPKAKELSQGEEKYRRDAQAARSAHILITNHATLVLDAMRGQFILSDPNSQPLSMVMVDEAHAVTQAAESLTQGGLSLKRYQGLAAEMAALVHAMLPQAPKAGKQADAANAAIDALFAAVKQSGVPGRKRPLPEALADHAELMRAAHREAVKLGKTLEDLVGRRDEQALDVQAWERVGDYHEATEELSRFLRPLENRTSGGKEGEAGYEDVMIVEWSPKKCEPRLVRGSTNPGRVLNRYFGRLDAQAPNPVTSNANEHPRAVIFTSATLRSPRGSAGTKMLEWELGIFRSRAATMLPFATFSPERFGWIERIVLANRDVPTPYTKESDEEDESGARLPTEGWLKQCARTILKASEYPGRTLVLGASFPNMEMIAARLPATLKSRVILHERGERIAGYLEEYARREGAILLTPSAWVGVDLPGLIQHLVLTRIPREPMNSDANIIAEEEIRVRLPRDSQERRNGLLLDRSTNRALRKTMQGLCRALRKEDDAFSLWVCDPRFELPDALIAGKAGADLDRAYHEDLCVKPGPRAQGYRLEALLPARFRPAFERAQVLTQSGELI